MSKRITNYLYNTVNDSCDPTGITNDNIKKIADIFGLKNVTRENICNKIKEYYNIQDKVQERCQNDTTILGDSINDISPFFFVNIIENNKIFCGDIRDFIKLDKNPYTGVPFSDELKEQFFNNFQKMKSIVKNYQDKESEEITKSLSVLMADIFIQIPYPNSIHLFLDGSKTKVLNFVNQLLRYNIISDNDFKILLDINDLYNLKFATATLLKLVLNKNIDSYSITYAYNSVFTNELPNNRQYIDDQEEFNNNRQELLDNTEIEDNSEYGFQRRSRGFANDNYFDDQDTEMDLDISNELQYAQEEIEQELLESISENNTNKFNELINDRTAVVSLDLLLKAIEFNRKEMISIIITKLEIMGDDDIEEIVKEIIYNKHYHLLPYLIDEKNYIEINDIYVEVYTDIFNEIPQYIKEYIRNNNCILYPVDPYIDIDESYERSSESSRFSLW